MQLFLTVNLRELTRRPLPNRGSDRHDFFDVDQSERAREIDGARPGSRGSGTIKISLGEGSCRAAPGGNLLTRAAKSITPERFFGSARTHTTHTTLQSRSSSRPQLAQPRPDRGISRSAGTDRGDDFAVEIRDRLDRSVAQHHEQIRVVAFDLIQLSSAITRRSSIPAFCIASAKTPPILRTLVGPALPR
jgi:hypothetical protein